MKASKLILIYFFLPLCSYSQLKVDAGNDTAVCYSEKRFRLGGNPTATGGVPPYVYTWVVKQGNSDFSNLLDYSNSSNPNFQVSSISHKGRISFILTVTDSVKNIMSDTMIFTVSFMGWSHLSFFGGSCHFGDSLQLDIINDCFGIPPFKYQWTPTTGLSDPTARNPWLKPTANCDFSVTITDSVGCVGRDMFYVLVNFTSIETVKTSMRSYVFPNPVSGNSTIYLNESTIKQFDIKVFDLNGRLILYDTFHQDYPIGEKVKAAGVYFYVIQKREEVYSVGKIIKL